MVEVPVGNYRYSDDAHDELPKTRSVESDLKTRRQKFRIHQVQAVIEQMDVDSDEESGAPHDVAIKRNQAGTRSSKCVAAVAHTDSNKRKSTSRDRYGGSGSDLEDVELDDSRDDFINHVTRKLQTFATDQETDGNGAEDRGRSASTRKNKLSLKKTDSKDRRETATTQKPTTKLHSVTPSGNMEAWDMIETVSDSDSGDQFHFESRPSGSRPTLGQHKSVDAVMPKRARKMIPSDADKKKQMPDGQLVKSGSRPKRNLKYCKQDDFSAASEEITVEEDESDAADEDFVSLVSNSPAAASDKGRTPSKKLTSSFWLTSPESRKSVYNTDDDEFVSNSASYKRLFVVLCSLFTWITDFHFC